MKNIFIVLLCIFLTPPLRGQNNVHLSVVNQSIEGNEFYFDIIINGLEGDSDFIFLSHSDFVLDFNEGLFNNPVFSKVTSVESHGFCNLLPRDRSVVFDSLTKIEYYDATSTSIKDGYLIANLNTTGDLYPGPIEKAAYISYKPSGHRFGRFKVSGLSTATGSMELVWNNSSTGLRTIVLGRGESLPWHHQEAEITFSNPPSFNFGSATVFFSGQKMSNLTTRLHVASAPANFEIERRAGDDKWKTLISHRGEEHIVSQEFDDLSPIMGMNTYRLHYQDHKGRSLYSDPIVIDYRAEDLKIYPNPASEELFTSAATGEPYKIYDRIGKMILDGNLDTNIINIRSLPPGIYILIVNGTQSFKFAKN